MKTRFRFDLSNRAAIAASLLLSFCGCQSVQPSTPVALAPALPSPSAPGETPDALSYGMVTGKVQKNVTTQTEILELFGGPSTMTTDRDGTEVWMFDKTASTTSGNQQQSAAQTDRQSAAAMGAFLGLPILGIGGGAGASQSQSAQASQSTTAVTRSVKTITFIIKFNADKTVKDYAVRQASY